MSVIQPKATNNAAPSLLSAFSRGRRWQAVCSFRCQASAHERSRTTSLQLSHPSGCSIRVFGVEHLTRDDKGAEFIIENSPSTVVVETALDPSHGSATGNTVTLNSRTDDFFINMFQQIGRQLAMEQDALASQLWQSLKPRWAGEQLAYIAAFAVAADIVYGDSVKHNTFRQLASNASLTDLDFAFGTQSWLNYLEVLDGKSSQPLEVATMGVVDRAMLTQREAVMCRSLCQAAESGRGCVVGIFGESHLPGIQRLWQDSQWTALQSESAPNPSSPAASSSSSTTAFLAGSPSKAPPFQQAEDGLEALEGAGVRRALLESVIRLKSVPSVVDDLRRALGEVPEESWEAYCWAHELYASPRMLLASLSRDQLARVCSGWRCDMWQVLQPLRETRPINGGTGLDIDLTMELRSLNYDFSS